MASSTSINYPQTPAAGIRYPAVTTALFPSPSLTTTGPIQFTEPNGDPIYVCSVLLNDNSVCPGKCGPGLTPAVRYPYGGSEKAHDGRYDILPITERMEWVPASEGKIPRNRRPVEGGYEVNGAYLYHASVPVEGGSRRVPGKTGQHLGSATAAYGNAEVVVKEGYEILCWR